jgi:RNase P protein component
MANDPKPKRKEYPEATGQNALKREAIRRLLMEHPEWSDRRIAKSCQMVIYLPAL